MAMAPKKDTPRVDHCIGECVREFEDYSPEGQAKYFEEVHQRLAPLARKLERENAQLKEEIARLRRGITTQ